MKIKVEQWGPVGSCEYDLSKFITLMYGTNNIGKSYAMQMAYLAIKCMLQLANRYFREEDFIYFPGNRREWRDVIVNFRKSQDRERNLTDIVIHSVEKFFSRRYLDDLKQSLQGTFGNYENLLCQETRLRIGEPKKTISFLLEDEKVSVS